MDSPAYSSARLALSVIAERLRIPLQPYSRGICSIVPQIHLPLGTLCHSSLLHPRSHADNASLNIQVQVVKTPSQHSLPDASPQHGRPHRVFVVPFRPLPPPQDARPLYLSLTLGRLLYPYDLSGRPPSLYWTLFYAGVSGCYSSRGYSTGLETATLQYYILRWPRTMLHLRNRHVGSS